MVTINLLVCVLCLITLFTVISMKNVRLVTLSDLSGGHSVTGDDIILDCKTSFDARYVSVIWQKPEHLNSADFEEEVIPAKNSTVYRLKIYEADESYYGWYQCKIVHKEWNYSVSSNRLLVPIYNIHDHHFNFANINFDPVTAKIEVTYRAHPNVIITWFDNNDEIITESSRFVIHQPSLINNGQSNYRAALEFKNISRENFGIYTVNAHNKFENQSQKIDVYLGRKVLSNLSIESEDGMQAMYRCDAAGYQKPTITWYFVPCSFCLQFKVQSEEKRWMMTEDSKMNDVVELFDADESVGLYDYIRVKFMFMTKYERKESYSEDKGLQVASFISLNLSETGTLACVTQDSVQMERIFYVHNGFDILTNDDAENIGSAKEVIYPTYGHFMNILCVISHDYVPKIKWFHNGRKMEDYLFYTYGNYTLLDKTVHKLKFRFLSENQLGNYSCQVLKKGGTVDFRTVVLKLEQTQMFLPKAFLQDLNKGHTVVGENVSFKCEVKYYKPISEFFWGVVDSKQVEYGTDVKGLLYTALKLDDAATTVKVNSSVYSTISRMTIPQASQSNSTYLLCGFNTLAGSWYGYLGAPVYGTSDSVLVFYENISVFDRHEVKIKIYLKVHPRPTVYWLDNNGTKIQNQSSKFCVTIKEESMVKYDNDYTEDLNYEAVLSFKSLHHQDFGNYTLIVDNYHKRESYSIEVNVTGVPSVKIDIDESDKTNTTKIIKCTSIGYPVPSIKWYLSKCSSFDSCFNFKNKKEIRHEINGLQLVSYVSVNISETGYLRCQSSNSFGKKHIDQPILYVVKDIQLFVENMKQDSSRKVEIIGFKKLQITCAVSTHTYTNKIVWSLNFASVVNMNDTFLDTKIDNFVFASASVLQVRARVNFKDYYTCHGLTKEGLLKSRTLIIESRDVASASINKTNMFNGSTLVKLSSSWKFYCHAEGFPTPTVKWYKNDHTIESSQRIKIMNNSQVLYFSYVYPEDEGVYKCQVSNKYRESGKIQTLIITNRHTWLYVQLSLLLLATTFVTMLYVLKSRKDKMLARDLLYFEEGALKNLNPNLRIEDQANLLPYDRRWEIPLESVKLGRQLGSGAFGTVFQAEIENFFPNESSRTVAVKTIDPQSGFKCVKALASELKIMAHLGKHINIVNFLGACTKNIARGELYAIVEYCTLGNLRDYLLRHCKSFVDQKDNERDEYDYSIQEKEEVAENSVSLCSKDLLTWSFQIARGMEYLSCRRIVHGDLAARNILLTENNVVKISDFGLSKKLYELRNYTKQEQKRLPVKWLAIESIGKGIFCTESDVWSFGIVLWEIFSLGETPYPGIAFDETFYKKLLDGYRMEAPEAATKTIYKIMLECWNSDPLVRPSFADLVARIGAMLDEPVKNYYVDMTSGYVSFNEGFVGSEDYLMNVNVPSFRNIASASDNVVTESNYVNTEV